MRAATGRRGGHMSKIDRVEVHSFTYEVPNLGLPRHGAAGVANVEYMKGGRLPASRYAIRIGTDDGLVGEYVTHWVGTPASLAQTHHAGAAPDRPRPGDARIDLRRPQARAARLRPHGPRPPRHRPLGPRRQEVRRLRSQPCSAASASACRPMPAPITARRAGAASAARPRSPTSPSTARISATAASRSTAGTTATRGARLRTCWACAPGSATTWR